MIRYVLLAVMTSASVVALSGCAASGGNKADVTEVSVPENAATLLRSGEWVVEDIDAGGIIDRSRVTISFDKEGRVAGKASCNSFMGGYTQTGNGLVFAGIATTMMACPTALMDQEREFLATLGAVTRFELTPDGALILHTDDQRTLKARRG